MTDSSWEGFEINVAAVLIDGDAKLADFDFFFVAAVGEWSLQWENGPCSGRMVPAVVVFSILGPCSLSVSVQPALTACRFRTTACIVCLFRGTEIS